MALSVKINMVARGKAVRNAAISGRRAITKPMRKTPSTGRDIEGEVNEVQIPGTKIDLWRPLLDTLVLAYVFGTREDETFLRLKAVLAPFGITHFYTDGWGAYRRHIDPDKHTVGKQHTQKIERKHTTLRARIKRLVRKTICFSKSIQMHDLVIGLFINRFAYGRAI